MREPSESLENEVKSLRKELLFLKESEEKFRSAFKSSADSITITRLKDGLIVEINDGFTAITGYSWEDVKGKTSADLGLWVNSDQRKQLFETLQKKGEVKGVEVLFRAKSGQIIHSLFSASIIHLNNEPYFTTVARNIDVLKKTEESLRNAQEVGKVGSWELDWVSRKLTWSDQLYRIFELDKNTTNPDYQLFKSIIHPDDRDKAMKILRHSITNKTSYFHVHRVVLANGKLKWIEERGSSFYDETGKPLRSVGAVQDITEKKLANDALIKSERLFQSLATSSPVGIFRTDAKGLTTYVNPKWCHLSGLARTDAMGEGWLKAVHPEDRDNLNIKWKESAAEKGISTSEYRFLHPDGKIVYVKGQAVPEFDDSNNVIGYVGTITDITEQKLADEALHKAHNDLVDTLENMTDGFTSVDKNWNYLYVNRKAGEILGRDPAQLIGKNVWEEFPEMLETIFYEQSIKAMQNRKPVAFENYYAPKKQWFENRLVPSGEGLSTFFQDITKRKLANEQLREKEELLSAIARNYPNSIVAVLNNKLEIEFISGRFLLDKGYNLSKIMGKKATDIIASYQLEDIPEIGQVYRDAFNGLDVSSEISFLDYHFVFYAIPLFRENDQVTKILTITEDITQQKNIKKELQELNENLELKVKQRTEKLEKSEQAMLYLLEDMKDTQTKLQKSNEKLQLLNKELEAFSYSVSHDLKAPLRAINGFSNFLKEDYYDKLGSDGKHLLDDIIKNAENMGALIDGLLQLSRTGRKAVKRINFDLRPVAISIFSEQMKFYNLPGAVLEVADGLPGINADYTLMKQLLANLFSNALKYASKKPRQKVKLGWITHKKKIIYFIKDNGVGFDMRYAAKMFDTFQRLHSKAEYEGTGIGLSIVKRIVNKHGGEIWAESEVDKGTTIYFSI